MDFSIKLPIFEGPFDLLLFFIERDELEVYDIPIAKVTNDFLDYLHQLQELNMEVAGDFIVVAATLMRIKSKMLLPRVQLDEFGNEIDPREELVSQILEYKRYKPIIDKLFSLEEQMLERDARGNVIAEISAIAAERNIELDLQEVDLFRLLQVFQQTMVQYMSRPRDEDIKIDSIIPYAYTLDGQRAYLLAKVEEKRRVYFSEIVQDLQSRIALIFTFLAMLEMLQQQLIRIDVGEGFNNFRIWVYEATSPTVE
ncbi:MAG: chromosome segregation protein ScpA [Cytophagales bacterium]|nr:MAG: chromosome segregation protein ScpA [Cytophagales bacterium]